MISRTLWTGTPGAEKYRKVGPIDIAVAVEISRMAGVRTPGTQKHRQIVGIDDATPIDIAHTIRSEG